ncbi:MAG: hypothetical protein AB1810_09080 [Pseudomonadota bacterium]
MKYTTAFLCGLRFSVIVVLTAVLCACGGGGSGGDGGGTTTSYTLGGTVSGLAGTVVLQNNGGDSLSLSSNGVFTFSTPLADGTAYTITVSAQPSGQTCGVVNSTGTIGGANVSNVAMICVTLATSYTISGTVSGLTGTGLVLQNNGGDDLSITANGDFTFANPLSGGAMYSVTILNQPAGQTCTVANGGGTIAGADVTNVSITCTTTGWGTAQRIETGAGNADDPQVAVDSSGNAIAVWRQNHDIWANRFNAESGAWGAAQLIETGAGNADDPQITVDSSGNAIAVWSQYDGLYTSIWTNRFSAESGAWGAAQLIGAGVGYDASDPQIAVDGSGNAIAVWRHKESGRYRYAGGTWAKRFNAESGAWGAAQMIGAGDTALYSVPQIAQIAVADSGNAIVVWPQHSTPYASIWANRFSVESGAWDAPQLIETSVGDAYSPQIAVDGSGNAIAVWSQHDGSTYTDIWANRFSTASGVWGTAQLIDPGAGHAYSPQIAVDGGGNAIAVWVQNDQNADVWTNRFSAVSGTWSGAQLIETGVGEADFIGGPPQIAVDGSGNAIAVWVQIDDAYRNSIWANRFSAESGAWETAQMIENGVGHAYSPGIAVDGSGNAIAVWMQHDNSTNYDDIWANRYE